MPVVGGDVHIISRDLRSMPTEIRKEITPAIRRAAQPILRAAKANASWSTRIPGSLRIVVLKSGVAIRASRKRAPHARPYEGIGSTSRVFRHPVFGRDVWVAERTRPFLVPAVRPHAREVRKAIESVVDDAAQRHGFN